MTVILRQLQRSEAIYMGPRGLPSKARRPAEHHSTEYGSNSSRRPTRPARRGKGITRNVPRNVPPLVTTWVGREEPDRDCAIVCGDRGRGEGRCSSVADVAFRVAASRVPGATLLLHFHRFGSQAVARKLLSNIGLDLFSRQNVGIGIGLVALAELGNAPAI
jgi:hypothetical protein